MISHIEKPLYFKAQVHRCTGGLGDYRTYWTFFSADDMYFRKVPHTYSIE